MKEGLGGQKIFHQWPVWSSLDLWAVHGKDGVTNGLGCVRGNLYKAVLLTSVQGHKKG